MIIVCGSINVDLVVKPEKLPVAGETVLSDSYEWLPGGKGSNQAVSAARAGGKVGFVGRIGDDGFGTRMFNLMKKEGIWMSGVVRDEEEPTGIAMIAVDKSGENQIVVASGANNKIIEEQIPDDILGPSNVLLLQMEIPHHINWGLLKRAHEIGAKTILNLAPAAKVPKSALDNLDYLIVNHIEGQQMAEQLGLDIDKDAENIARKLAQSCNLTCIMTLSEEGSLAIGPDGKGWKCGALTDVEVVDMTGAGDTYCGAFANAIHQNKSLDMAMREASVAASLACEHLGAQTGMPYGDDIKEALDRLPMPQAIS